MLDINRLNIVDKKVKMMVKAAQVIDETKLSSAVIIMLVSSVDTLTLLGGDLARSYSKSLKEDGCTDFDTASSYLDSLEEIMDGLELLVNFMEHLSEEMHRRVSRLKKATE